MATTYDKRKETWDQVMSGNYPGRDAFDYASSSRRVGIAEEMMLGSRKTDWEAWKCPMGTYTHTPRTVYSRLPIWC